MGLHTGDNKYGRNVTQNPGGGCVSIHGASLSTFQYVYILSKINVRGEKNKHWNWMRYHMSGFSKVPDCRMCSIKGH